MSSLILHVVWPFVMPNASEWERETTNATAPLYSSIVVENIGPFVGWLSLPLGCSYPPAVEIYGRSLDVLGCWTQHWFSPSANRNDSIFSLSWREKHDRVIFGWLQAIWMKTATGDDLPSQQLIAPHSPNRTKSASPPKRIPIYRYLFLIFFNIYYVYKIDVSNLASMCGSSSSSSSPAHQANIANPNGDKEK